MTHITHTIHREFHKSVSPDKTKDVERKSRKKKRSKKFKLEAGVAGGSVKVINETRSKSNGAKDDKFHVHQCQAQIEICLFT